MLTQVEAESIILLHRFLYFIEGAPILSDYSFDFEQRNYREEFENSAILRYNGSFIYSDYPVYIRKLAQDLLHSNEA